MTTLRYWYNTQSSNCRKQFRQFVADASGVSKHTVRRYLDTEAPKLTQQLISSFCNIPTNDLYKQKP